MQRSTVLGGYAALAFSALLAMLSGCAGFALSRPAATPAAALRVRIVRDTWGIPHVFGDSNADAAFGLAWAHAEDDFLTIERTIATVRGRLGEIDGPDGARSDYLLALLRVREIVSARYERDLSPPMRAVLEGYAAGLTFYAARHRDQLLLDDLLPIRGEDIVAGFVHKIPFFGGILEVLRELDARGATSDGVGDVHAAAVPAPASESDLASLTPTVPLFGSNAFALMPSRTPDGRTRLAVNSHQPWEGPVAWWEAQITSREGWSAYGGLFPGSPVVLHGINERLGWAHTVNRPDLIDAYRLVINPANPNEYRFDGAWRVFETRDVPLRVTLFGVVPWTTSRGARWSVHGPVLELGHGSERAQYALRIAGLDDVRSVEQWWRMNLARTREEWLAAMRMQGVPKFNTVYADAVGHVSYVYAARFPRRAEGYDWQGVLPGDTSAVLWDAFLPLDAVPQVHDPAAGFVQNANSTPYTASDGEERPDPVRFSHTLGIETQETERSLRLRALLGGESPAAATHFDDAAVDRVKWDQRFDGGGWVNDALAALASVPARSEDELRAQAMLARWDRTFSVDSREAALAVLALDAFDDARERRGPVPDATRALRDAITHLRTLFARLDPTLGELQRLRRGDVDLPIGGGPDVLNATYATKAGDGRLVGQAGDCFVLLASFGADGAQARAIHQFGSSSRPGSPHFADQAPLFVQRRTRPVWLREDEIRAHAEADYHPGEAH